MAFRSGPKTSLISGRKRLSTERWGDWWNMDGWCVSAVGCMRSQSRRASAKARRQVEHVIFAAAQTRGETVAAHGSVAAYNLGLTTRAPAKLIYLTSGPSRRMTVGGEPVEFRHAPDWQLNVRCGAPEM